VSKSGLEGFTYYTVIRSYGSANRLGGPVELALLISGVGWEERLPKDLIRLLSTQVSVIYFMEILTFGCLHCYGLLSDLKGV